MPAHLWERLYCGTAPGRPSLAPRTGQLAQLVLVVAVAVCSARAGLLRVPRVYNALISTNQRLSPSRADTVSIPVVGPVALLPAAAVVAEEPAPPPAAKNASDAASGNHTTAAAAALVAPLAVYSPYYYPAYPYHYSPYLLPPAPLLHYSYSYLPLALAHPAAEPAGESKPEAQGAKVDADKDAVSVEAN